MELLDAIKNGDEEAVQKLLRNVTRDHKMLPDDHGRTPLSWAAGNGNFVTVQRLVNAGFPTDDTDSDGRTAMSWAAENGHVDVVKLLLEEGADEFVRDDEDKTPLAWAAEKGHINIVQILNVDSHNEKYSRMPLYCAVESKQNEVVKLLLESLLESGNHINARERDPNDPDESTLLEWAVQAGQPDFARMLLENGADIELPDPWSHTPLLQAAELGLPIMVEFLLENGANIEAADEDGCTAFDYAIAREHQSVADLLEAWECAGDDKSEKESTMKQVREIS